MKLTLKELEQIKKNFRTYIPKILYDDIKRLLQYVNYLEQQSRVVKFEETKKQQSIFGGGLFKWQIDLATLYEKHGHNGAFVKYYKALGLKSNDAEDQAKKAILALHKLK